MADGNPCFYALVLIGAGSSWCYNPDKDKAVEGVIKIIKDDWRPKPGAEIKVNVFDVSDVPNGTKISNDYDGIWVHYPTGKVKLDKPEVVTVTI